METGKRNIARLFIIQVLLMAFLLAFVLTIPADRSRMAFSGELGDVPGEVMSPSLYGLLWTRHDLAKTVLRAGFPIIGYMERYGEEHEAPGVMASIFGWFMGFTPIGAQDLILAQLPGFTSDVAASVTIPQNLEEDWGLSPVLYSLPPGEGGQAASVGLTTPTVAIYHTHATESYLPEIGKKAAEAAFTSDTSRSVIKVGEYLISELENRYRIACVHSKTIHDADSRVGAYYRSEQTVKALLEKYPSCALLIDLHRDSQPKNLTTVTIRGKSYARLMLVVGTDNPNWVKNYELARKIVSMLEDAYPGISRGILYASAYYNQHYSPNAILVEVGGVDNTLAECKNSMEALAWVIASLTLPAAPAMP